MFKHPGDAAAGSPPHWHYLSLGFSDLYGDGRIFAPVQGMCLAGSISQQAHGLPAPHDVVVGVVLRDTFCTAVLQLWQTRQPRGAASGSSCRSA